MPLVGVDLGDTNVVPVDYVARAMDHLAHQPDLDGQAFHLVNPEPLSTVGLINSFASAAKAPQFAVPVDRTVTSRLPTALLPQALRPAALVGAALRLAPVHVALNQTIGRLGVPPEVLEHASFPSVYASRSTEKALAGLGHLGARHRVLRLHPVVVLGGDARRLHQGQQPPSSRRSRARPS